MNRKERFKKVCDVVGGEVKGVSNNKCELPSEGEVRFDSRSKKVNVTDADNELIAELYKIDDFEVLPEKEMGIASAGDSTVIISDIRG